MVKIVDFIDRQRSQTMLMSSDELVLKEIADEVSKHL